MYVLLVLIMLTTLSKNASTVLLIVKPVIALYPA